MPTVSVLHILRTIKDRGSISRTDLQQLTGLSWGTITNTTRELLDRKLIIEEGAASTKAGRKPMRLTLNRVGQFLIGVDIAPDGLRCLVMNLAGEVLWREAGAGAVGDSSELVLARAVALVTRAYALPDVRGRNCLGVGVAIHGRLDRQRGLLDSAVQGWKRVTVLGALRTGLGVSNGSIVLERNTNCLLMAERWFGAAGKAECFICIDLGEVVGMGALWGGEIFRGSQDLACEFGHMTLDVNGPLCTCGDRGCVEAFCAIPALLSYAQSVASGGDRVAKMRTVESLTELATEKNNAALETFARMGQQLGTGIANLIDVFNPEMVVLAGPSVGAREHFLPTLNHALETHAWAASARKVVISQLGAYGAAMGACGMVLERTFARITAEVSRPNAKES